MGKGAEVIVPNGVYRFAAAIGDPPVAVQHFFVIGKNEFPVHGGGKPRAFLAVHIAPDIGGVVMILVRGQLVGKAVRALGYPLAAGGGKQPAVLFLRPEQGNIVVCELIHHAMELFRIVIHGEKHVFHAHQMNDILHRAGIQGMTHEPCRKDFSEQLVVFVHFPVCFLLRR